MTKPIEFGEFYKLIQAVKDGDEAKNKELEWMLAEYEHAKDSTSPYDELGQIFCHHGVMELYDYTGTDDIKYINSLNKSVWDYLLIRMNISLSDYMVKSMLSHAKEHHLASKMSNKWKIEIDELESNLEDLAKYVTEGIVELII